MAMDIAALIQSLHADIVQLEQQEINLIAEANRQIGQVQGALAAKRQLLTALTANGQSNEAPATPAPTEET